MINFFNPKSIAIIGASNNPQKLGNQLLKNLINAGFEGQILPINLKEKEVLGLKAFQSVLDIHRSIDFAVIIVPREIVPHVLKQCVLKNIPTVLIISAGFAEKDLVGKKLQQELLEITKNTKTKIIGPNCLGIIDTANNVNLTFAAAQVLRGDVSLILQSGAMGAAIFDWAKANEIGINKFISLGNKIHISETEVIEILTNDPKTKAIVLYLEEIKEPKLFLEKCRELSAKKPIIILKGGMSAKGAQAASSHTGALSSPEELNTALFRQANLIVAEDYEELLDFLELFSSKVFDIKKNNLGIITNAGGIGILAVDATADFKINLPKLSLAEQKKLSGDLASYASLANPFDLGGDADTISYKKVLDFLERSNLFSAILVIVTPQSMTQVDQIAEILAATRYKPCPIMASFLGGPKIKNAQKILAKSHIPNYDDPREAIALLAKISSYFKKNERAHDLINIATSSSYVNQSEEALIARYGIPFAPFVEVMNDADLMGHIEEIGYPIVYKAAKVKARGKRGKVGLNINDHQSLEQAVRSIGFPGILQKMIDAQVEIIIGARRDPRFGITVLFGEGGIFVEEQMDINFRILPLTDKDLDEMIEETKVWQILKRTNAKNHIKNVILKIAQLMTENNDIKEIELNPLKVTPQGIIAVDINIKRDSK